MTHTGRNDLCPCGSGTKYKRCCLDRESGLSRRAEMSSGQASPLVSYTLALDRLQRATVAQSIDPIDILDRRFMSLDLPRYATAVHEIAEDGQLTLLPVEMPRVFEQCVGVLADHKLMAHVVQAIGAHEGFGRYHVGGVDQTLPEFVRAFRHDDYSFEGPTDGVFPFVLRRITSPAYAPQYVSNVPVFSKSLEDLLEIPVIHYSQATPADFMGTVSFVHEVLHVMQRVLRKRRIPHYVYVGENGARIVRNPEIYVRVGVEDEIEVQKILVRAGYEFSLRPVLHHRNNIEQAFAAVSPAEAQRAIRHGIESIPFDKYVDLFDGKLRSTILQEFCGP